MKSFLTKAILCLVPVVLSAGVVAWAAYEYEQGRGGFRLGVDLSGGTILIYEVDPTKRPQDFKPEDLAASLKRRIDPADLYNVTIRPAGTDRVEIVLPTGGRHQAQADKRTWDELIRLVSERYPVEGKDNPYAEIPQGQVVALEGKIVELKKLTDPKDIQEVSSFIRGHYSLGTDRRRLDRE